MSAPVSGLDVILARIASIQSTFSTLSTAALAPSSTTATASSTTDFADALSTASPTTDATSTVDGAATAATTSAAATNPVGTVNGVTYSPSAADVSGADVVATAESYLGVPYVYAGNDRNGIDCSGLVQQTYKSLGMQLPRVSWDQQKVGTEVGSLAQAKPGDVLCFGEPAYHVAIYLGNNKMIEAPKPGENVHISTVWATPSHIRRIVADPSTTDSSTSVSAASGLSAGQTAATSTTSVGPGLGAYTSMFQSAQNKYHLPAGLLAAVAQVESGGNASAVSPAGALGLMQLMPGTAASLGVNPLNPTQAVDGAARMLSGLLTKYHGSTTLALAAYNAGSGAVDQYGGVPPYTETQNYVVKVQHLMAGSS